MGSIQIFNLTKYIEQYKCKIYVETGTGAAECLSHAITFPFEKYHTIDIDGDLIEPLIDICVQEIIVIFGQKKEDRVNNSKDLQRPIDNNR